MLGEICRDGSFVGVVDLSLQASFETLLVENRGVVRVFYV